MYKLLLVPLMLVIWLSLYGSGVDQELAMKTYYKAKQAVNRGAHAAALQLDQSALAEGIFQIEHEKARIVAEQYVYQNLSLDQDGNPTPASFIREPVEIVYFEVLGAEQAFPLQYELEQYAFKAIFHAPAVIIVLHVKYPSVFSNENPVEWNIVGSAQLIPL